MIKLFFFGGFGFEEHGRPRKLPRKLYPTDKPRSRVLLLKFHVIGWYGEDDWYQPEAIVQLPESSRCAEEETDWKDSWGNPQICPRIVEHHIIKYHIRNGPFVRKAFNRLVFGSYKRTKTPQSLRGLSGLINEPFRTKPYCFMKRIVWKRKLTLTNYLFLLMQSYGDFGSLAKPCVEKLV